MFNSILTGIRDWFDSYEDDVTFIQRMQDQYTPEKILPDFVLHSKRNKFFKYLGIDKSHNNYPYDVSYQFNSRGYRDSEWPDNLVDPIWCIGDSCTVGIGCPVEHTWTHLLGNTINVSMEGASNQWIARKAIRVLQEIKPKTMILQWSFITRGEDPDATLDDEDRRLHFYDLDATPAELLKIFADLVDQVEQNKQSTRVIHTFVPNWALGDHSVYDLWNRLKGPDWPAEPVVDLEPFVIDELVSFGEYDFFKTYAELTSKIEYIPEIVPIDYARDNFHYDQLTAQLLVNKIKNLLEKTV